MSATTKRLHDPVPPEFTAFAKEFKASLIARGAFFVGQTETRDQVIAGRRIRAVVERHTSIGATNEARPDGIPGVSLFEVLDDTASEPEASDAPMRISPAGLDAIAKWEGVVLHVYRDPVGIPTIGAGHVVLPGESFPPTITHDEAMDLLRKDVAVAEAAVVKLAVELEQHEFDALVSLAFNIGGGAFAKSTLAKKLKAGDKAGAAAEFLKWDKAGGKVVPGLHNRRVAERALFLAAESPAGLPPVLEPAPRAQHDLDSVAGLQHALNVLGASPALVEDGVVGPKTIAATKIFQRTHRLTPSGAFDLKTKAAIAAALEVPA